MIVTGASGIVGRQFLETAKEDFFIYGIARRSQDEADIPPHPNIKWVQVDIANYVSLKSAVLAAIKSDSTVDNIDFVLHLASYYDLNYSPHPEYERTNVKGTRNLLELSKLLKVRRFVFASSLAACHFPGRGEKITEKSLADADYPYARSKKVGEELVREFSAFFPCSIVRPAAVFTDWCEYGILYMMLSRWFSRKLGSKVLEGKGEAAIPYLHSNDLNKFLLTIFRKSNELPDYDIYIASPDGSTSHRQLFETAEKFYFREKIKPFFLPKVILAPLVIARDIMGRLIGKRPLERPWMLKYVDLKLDIDSSHTRKTLSWEPNPRFHILRRLLYLVEKMKIHPEEWQYKNARALKRIPQRPNLLIYEIMVKLKNEMIDEIKQTLLNPRRRNDFSNYQRINRDNFNWDVGVFYQLLTASVRNKDRMLLMNYAADFLSPIRFSEGFKSREVCMAILDAGKIVISRLLKEPELKGMEELIHDYIFLTIQLTVDEVENAFEKLDRKMFAAKVPQRSDIEDQLKELATFCIRDGNNFV
jgi:nucleoside-diphosphate-sugar epimerase